jgi:hypothetical protein
MLPKLGVPDVGWSRFTLFGLRSLIQSPAWARDGMLSDLGFGLELVSDTRKGRTLENRSGLQAELLGVAGHGERFQGHLAFGLGVTAFGAWGDTDFGFAGGTYATVLARAPLPGHGANGLRAEGRYTLLARMYASNVWLEELDVKAGADVKVGPVLVEPRLIFSVQRANNAFTTPTFAAAIAFERAYER